MVQTGGTYGTSYDASLEAPTTGTYWLRKRVPDDLRPLIGKREEKRSPLRTKDAAETKRMLAAALVEERWANLRRGPVELTEPHATALALSVSDA